MSGFGFPFADKAHRPPLPGPGPGGGRSSFRQAPEPMKELPPEHCNAFRVQKLLNSGFKKDAAFGRKLLVRIIEQQKGRHPGKSDELERQIVVE
jgi:hypothetical protein